MGLIVKDRVVETTTTTGTGVLALSGAVVGYRPFSDVMGVGDTCYYAIEAIDTNGVPTGDWETGLGTYSATGALTRTTVHASSNAGAAVAFVAGQKRVMMAPTATQLTSFATGAGLEVYTFQSSTNVVVSSAPTVVTDVCTVTIPASTSARTFVVNGTVTWNQGHGMRGQVTIDGARVWPTSAHLELNPITSGDGAYFLVFSGVIITIPGDGASHTIGLAWTAQASTAGLTIQERTLCALKVA
jgi:hypothetical protein